MTFVLGLSSSLSGQNGFELPPNDFRISFIGPPGANYAAVSPRAAYDPQTGEYFVVWASQWFGAQPDEVSLQRIDGASGELLGGPIRIDQSPDSEDTPVAALDPEHSELLVVWVEAESRIVARRFDTALAVPLGDTFVISEETSDHTDVAVAFDPVDDEFGVAWVQVASDPMKNPDQVFARRVEAGTGALVSGVVGPLTGIPRPCDFRPLFIDLAFSPEEEEYLLVWSGPTACRQSEGIILPVEVEVFGQRLNARLGQIGADDLQVSSMEADPPTSAGAAFPAVAYNSAHRHFLVAWSGWQAAGGLSTEEVEIYYRRLRAGTGEPIEADEVRITDVGGLGVAGYEAWSPAIALNEELDRYLVTWWGEDDEGGMVRGEYEIFGQWLDGATGREIGPNDVRLSDLGGIGSTSHIASEPAAAWASGSGLYLVVWRGDDPDAGVGTNQTEVLGQRLIEASLFEDGFESGDAGAWDSSVN